MKNAGNHIAKVLMVRLPPGNQGVVLRRLQDQNVSAPVNVSVNGKSAGIWPGGDFQGNPSKRLLESECALPPRLTAHRSTVIVTLAPVSPEEAATAYSLQAFG